MTPKELISTLKQLHEAAAGGDPEKCENLELAVSSELPRIIRLLEAGEMVAKSAKECSEYSFQGLLSWNFLDTFEPGSDAVCRVCDAEWPTDAPPSHATNCAAVQLDAALSAYEEAGK